MVAGIVLFVLMFGGGALWFIWPKAAAAQSSQPFTRADGEKLSALHAAAQSNLPFTHADSEKLLALHIRQAAQEFDQLVKRLDEASKYAAQQFWTGVSHPRVAPLGGGLHLALMLRGKIEKMVTRDFGVTQFERRDLNRDRATPAVDEAKVHQSELPEYRVFYHQWKAGGVTSFSDFYKQRVAQLDKLDPV
jgi:hypothetical protein